MLEYINTGITNDRATESLDTEVKEARLKEEWRAEYMRTFVHDKDVYRDGYEDGIEQKTIQVYNNCIASGMSKEQAIEISGISEKNIPAEEK